MPSDYQLWFKLMIALGIGLLIGAERERRKGKGPSRSAAGIRTFAVVSLVGAVSIVLGGEILLAVSAFGVAVLSAIAYFRSLEKDPGLTTEAALLLTLLLGGLVVREPGLAAGLAVALAVLLAARNRIHHFVRTVLTENELNDALVIAAATLVVLPLIPDRYLGPFDAFNPRIMWIIVIMMLSIGAAGHVAQRLFGSRFGLPLAGLVSGFVSSVATIGSMGPRVTHNPGLLRPAVAGAVLSTVATVVQMAAILAVTSLPTLRELSVPLLCAGVVAVAYGALFTLKTIRHEAPDSADTGSAFSFGTALVFAAMISAVLVACAALDAWFGKAGLVAAAAVAGFADTHSPAVSVAAPVAAGKLGAREAALPVLVAFTTNTLTKIAVAYVSGNRRFAAQVIPGLILTLGAAWIGWALT